MNNLYVTVSSLAYFSSLTKIIEKAEMVELLRDNGPLTLFGPYDGAFGTYTTYEPEDLLHEIEVISLEEVLTSKDYAREIISDIIVPKLYPLKSLLRLNSVTTLSGKDISLSATNGNIVPDNSFVLNSDLYCTNGVIHVTDTVIRPVL